MGCFSSKVARQFPGHEDPVALASQTACKLPFFFFTLFIHGLQTHGSKSFFFQVFECCELKTVKLQLLYCHMCGPLMAFEKNFFCFGDHKPQLCWFVVRLLSNFVMFFFLYKKTITIFRIIIFYFLKVLGMKFQCLKLACFSFHCLLLCLCAIETRALTHLYVHLCMLVNL